MKIFVYRGPDKFTPFFVRWLEELVRAINAGVTATWASLDKTGSKLSEIESRDHSDLQGISQADSHKPDGEPGKHVTNAQAKLWTEAANSAIIAGKSVLTYTGM